MQVVLRAADVKIFIGGKVYPEVQSIAYTIDYGETSIYGIDQVFPQEIAPGKVTVMGTVSGIRIKGLGGLQGYGIRSKINEVLYAPYVSIRIKDRHSDSDILWIPNAKISREELSMQAKGIGRLNFNFIGIVPYNALDMA